MSSASKAVRNARPARCTADERASLRQHVARNLIHRCRVDAGSRLLVGVSGGRDSVSLLRLLCDVAPSLRIDLAVGHFDHRLRPDSGADAMFVSRLGNDLNLEVEIGTWADPRPGEAAARRARHEFLQRAALRHRCDAVALGHQAEDQIETILMRLGRGTGLRGLLGMPWRRRARADVVRPLLDVRRRELGSYLRAIGQDWREDPTNADLSRPRNRIRARVLPELDAGFGATWLENWSESLEDLRAVWDWLAREAQTLLLRARRHASTNTSAWIEACDLEQLRAAPEAVLRAALHMWLEDVGCANLSRAQIRACADLIRNGQSDQSVRLPNGASLVVEQENVTVVTGEGRVGAARRVETSKPPRLLDGTGLEEVDPESKYELEVDASSTPRLGPVFPNGDTARSADPAAEPSLRETSQVESLVGADRVAQPLRVRRAREGERVRLLGAPGSRKVVRLLQDRRIPRRLRPTWPVVADAQGIVWIPGIGIAERGRITAATRSVLRMRLRERVVGALPPAKSGDTTAAEVIPAGSRRPPGPDGPKS